MWGNKVCEVAECTPSACLSLAQPGVLDRLESLLVPPYGSGGLGLRSDGAPVVAASGQAPAGAAAYGGVEMLVFILFPVPA